MEKKNIFSPSGYERPDFPVSIGSVEKLFEPSVSSFLPDGRYDPVRVIFKQQIIQQLPFELVSTKKAFGYFYLFVKVTRR